MAICMLKSGRTTWANYHRRCVGKYLKHINSGLMHLHGKGLIHRDIKPANIFVAGKTCKIGDFGLTIEEETASRPDFDQLAGTPQYLPYDVWSGNVGPRAAGVTFGAWDAPCNLVVLVMVSFKGFLRVFFEWLFCFNCFASNGFCNNLRYEMVTGELLYYDPPDEYTEVPAVNWPAFKEALQTAFYELMSTPTRRIGIGNGRCLVVNLSRVFFFCFVWL